MAKIKALKTGDIFEAPAADFEGEADFQVVDDSTPTTIDVPPSVGNDTAPTAGVASAPVAVIGDVVGEPVPAVDASTGATSGDAVSGTDTASGLTSGDVVGNAGVVSAPLADSTGAAPSGTTVDAPVSNPTSDTGAADAATPVVNPGTPPTDSVASSPTGGPTPGSGATLDAKSKHLVAAQLEADVLFAVAQLVTVTDTISHAADAFFTQVTSQIDVEAVQ
jgi:hypothetical protein